MNGSHDPIKIQLHVSRINAWPQCIRFRFGGGGGGGVFDDADGVLSSVVFLDSGTFA